MNFDGSNVEIIVENGEPLFEVYSTGMALGQVKEAKGKLYPHKQRIDNNLENSEIEPVVRNVQRYITEPQLYDLMLEMKTDKVKPFRKWVTGSVLPTIRKTGGVVIEGREEEFINKMFPSFTEEVKLAMVHDLRNQNIALKNKNDNLKKENKLLSGEVLSWDGRKIINALVRAYAGQSCYGNFGEAWVTFKKELLYKHSININKRITEYLNSTGKKTKPQTLNMLDDTEVANAVSTAVAMCKDNDVNIDEILSKYN